MLGCGRSQGVNWLNISQAVERGAVMGGGGSEVKVGVGEGGWVVRGRWVLRVGG